MHFTNYTIQKYLVLKNFFLVQYLGFYILSKLCGPAYIVYNVLILYHILSPQ